MTEKEYWKTLQTKDEKIEEYESVLDAINTIYRFFDDHVIAKAESFVELDTGDMLSTDWGFFWDGIREIERCCEREER